MKIRKIYTIVILSALLISILFGTITVINNANTQELKTSTAEYKDKVTENEQTVSQLQQQTQEKQATKDVLQAEYNRLMKIEKYKTVPTAFLTFDDGPNANTAQILDILKENNVTATFFVIAKQIEESETMKQVMRRTVEEGHTVAIHTYSHQYATIYQSVDAYFEDLYKAQQIIKDVTGVDSKLVRLPGGTATAKSYCKKYSGSEDTFPQIMKRLEEEGYTVSDWNIDTKDWESSTTVDGIISSVHRVAQAWHDNNNGYRTALVLMHNWPKTVKFLPTMINDLKNMGFVFESMHPEEYAYVQRTS